MTADTSPHDDDDENHDDDGDEGQRIQGFGVSERKQHVIYHHHCPTANAHPFH
jgi:hypothetical protein